MEVELEVLAEAQAALTQADAVNPDAQGPLDGLGLYGATSQT